MTPDWVAQFRRQGSGRGEHVRGDRVRHEATRPPSISSTLGHACSGSFAVPVLAIRFAVNASIVDAIPSTPRSRLWLDAVVQASNPAARTPVATSYGARSRFPSMSDRPKLPYGPPARPTGSPVTDRQVGSRDDRLHRSEDRGEVEAGSGQRSVPARRQTDATSGARRRRRRWRSRPAVAPSGPPLERHRPDHLRRQWQPRDRSDRSSECDRHQRNSCAPPCDDGITSTVDGEPPECINMVSRKRTVASG